jgi:hypothetical protein
VSGIVEQAGQLVGAVLILVAFAGVQTGWLDRRSHWYLLPNLVGSAALAADALRGQQWGFLLLEGAWAIVSLLGLLSTPHARGFAARAATVLAGRTQGHPVRPG